MNAPPTYGPHHGYHPDHHHHHQHRHHMPPPPPAYHAYPGHHAHYPPHSGPMMAPPPSSYAQAYAPHPGHHVHPSYGPHIAGASSMPPPPPHYTSYPHPPPAQHMTLPAISAPSPSAPPGSGAPNFTERQQDTTGQVAPQGVPKAKVAATLWEDEGTLCFQVEARSICVTRRHDNHMINGTKLLNVAGMTRGRRDGILKSEKMRKVMKVGPMHLKGVWIPYERALDFANKENITELLYPLFLHNIDALLSQSNGGGPLPVPGQAVGSRNSQAKDETGSHADDSTPQRATAHSAADSTGVHTQQPPNSIVPHPAHPRPGLERAQTLPQPPGHASSSMVHGNSGSSYEYGGPSSMPTSQTLFDSKSAPTTPESPDATTAGVNHYAAGPGYDARHSMSAQPTHQHAYGPPPGFRTDMGPPPRTSKDLDYGARSGYDAGYVYNTQHAYGTPVDTTVSPQSRESSQTAPGSSNSSHHWHTNSQHPTRSQTLPSSHITYHSKGTTNGYGMPGDPAHGYTYSSTSASLGKRNREDDNEPEHVELDSQKRQKTREEAAARYRNAKPTASQR